MITSRFIKNLKELTRVGRFENQVNKTSSLKQKIIESEKSFCLIINLREKKFFEIL